MTKDLLQALKLTRAMRDALNEGDLDKVEEISITRDKLLHEHFASDNAGGNCLETDKEIVRNIIELNAEMINLATIEKENIKDEARKELEEGAKSAVAIREYTDNM